MRKSLLVCALVLAVSGCAAGDPGVQVSTGEVQEDLSPPTTTPADPLATAPLLTTTTAPAPPPPTPAPQSAPQASGGWEVVPAGPLATRGEPKAVWTGKEVIVVGGLIIDQYQSLPDGAAFDPAKKTWRRIANRVPGRVLHAAWTGKEIVTLGSNGIDLDPITTAAAYNPATNTWRDLPLPPSTKSPHAVVRTGERVLIWQPAGAAPGALFEPDTNQWTPIPANNVPGAVSAGAAVWTGRELAIEGGMAPDQGGPAEQRLFLFDPAALSWRASSRPPTELSLWPFLTAGSADRRVAIVSDGKTLIYDVAADQWRSVTAPFHSTPPSPAPLAGGILVHKTGPLSLLDLNAARWSTTAAPPGPAVGDGVLVSTGTAAFVFGITTDGSYVEARQPNAAYLWRPDGDGKTLT